MKIQVHQCVQWQCLVALRANLQIDTVMLKHQFQYIYEKELAAVR